VQYRSYLDMARKGCCEKLNGGSTAYDFLPLAAGEITSLKTVSWFPDGRHLLLTGAAEGQPLRTYEMDLEGAKPQALGPADFNGVTVAMDGKRIAGRSAAGKAVMFNRETQKLEVIPGIEPQEVLSKWTEDGQALITYS
jgi:hypothetical protein